MDSKILLKGAYSADPKSVVRWIEERTPDQWSDGASLTTVLLTWAYSVQVEIQRRILKLQWLYRYPRSEPYFHDLIDFTPDQTHIRLPREATAPISRLRRVGLRRTRPFFCSAFLSHARTAVRPPGSVRTDQVLGITGLRQGLRPQVAFITAPSMTTPAVTYFQKATSSFRASATIVVLRIRPPLRLTRSWNHCVSAECG